MNFRSILKLLVWGSIAFGLCLWFLAPQLVSGKAAPGKMEYSELVTRLNKSPQSIEQLVIVNGTNRLKVKLAGAPGDATVLVTLPGKAGENQILDIARAKNVPVKAEEQKSSPGQVVLALLYYLLPTLIFVIVFVVLMRQVGGGPGQARGQLVKQDEAARPKVKFADVAGNEEAKQELEEIVRYLQNPGFFNQLGARAPRGILLVGSPGNGKTLMAKACAGEADASFISVSASEFVEIYVGMGASRVRNLFAEARKKKPAIIFIDEIDAVGRQRGAGVGGGHDEREQTLNQLLVEMDGFAGNEGIIMMAATNRPDVLDPAILRPGRFDRQVEVSSPDVVGREQILKIHTRNKPTAPDVDFRLLAERCPGFSGAEIEGACNEAATLAVRDLDKKIKELREAKASEQEIAALPRQITMAHFDEGIDRISMGVAKTTMAGRMSKEDMNNTSIHELGHATLAELLRHGDGVGKITIMPRSRALGYVQPLPKGDRYSLTFDQLLAQLIMIMGGRAAQEVLLGVVDTGAQSDFKQAHNIARRMVCEWGMSKLGPISVNADAGSPFLGRAMASAPDVGVELGNAIDAEVNRMVTAALQFARELIGEHKDFILAVNEVLLKKETLLAPEWQALVKEHSLPSRSVNVHLHTDAQTAQVEGEHDGHNN